MSWLAVASVVHGHAMAHAAASRIEPRSPWLAGLTGRGGADHGGAPGGHGDPPTHTPPRQSFCFSSGFACFSLHSWCLGFISALVWVVSASFPPFFLFHACVCFIPGSSWLHSCFVSWLFGVHSGFVVIWSWLRSRFRFGFWV